MRTKFALAATTAGLIVAMSGLAAAEGNKATSPGAAPAASSGSTTSKSTTTTSSTTAGRTASGMTLQEIKSDDAMAKSLNIRAKDLRGMDIYGADGKKIADVDHVLADQSNEIKAVSADVGGFLGMGTREVVIPIDKLTKGSEKDRLHTALTKDQIGKLDQWADASSSGGTSGSTTSGSSLSSNPSNTTGTSATGAGAPATSTTPAAPGGSATVPRSPSSGVAPSGR